MYMIENKKQDKLIVKHNKLIEFKGRMTTNELKLFSLIVADVRGQQERQFEEYKIDLSVLKETTKDKNFYGYIKDIAVKLEDKKIIVEGVNSNNKRYFTTIRLLHKPRYTEGDNYLLIDIDKDLIPYIINLKTEFTRYQIENILKLNSSYAVRIYELLKQYQKIGKRIISIEDLRDYLGIDSEEYKRFTNFESRVLKVAKKEINEYTDINIDYKKNKRGKTISEISFTIKTNSDDIEYINYLNEQYNIEEFKMNSGIEKENFDSKQVIELFTIATEILEDAEQQDLFEYIRLNYTHMIKNNTVKNKYAYLKKALKEDYAVARGQIKFDYQID